MAQAVFLVPPVCPEAEKVELGATAGVAGQLDGRGGHCGAQLTGVGVELRDVGLEVGGGLPGGLGHGVAGPLHQELPRATVHPGLQQRLHREHTVLNMPGKVWLTVQRFCVQSTDYWV